MNVNALTRQTQKRLLITWFAALFTLLLLLAGTEPAVANNHVGELIISKGIVKVRHLSGRETVYRQTGLRIPVFEGDVVQSAAKTKAKIIFRDGREVISIYANTSFKVEAITRKKSLFGLNIGKALFKIAAKFRRNTFTVRTSTATIGVKGTEFIAATDGHNTYVMTLTGVVTTASVAYPNVTVDVTKDTATSVAADEPPTTPVPVTPESREQIMQSDGLTEFNEVPFAEPVEVTPEDRATEEEGDDEAAGEEDSGEEGSGEEGSDEEGAPGGEAAAESAALLQEAQATQEIIAETQEAISTSTEEARPSTDVGPVRAPVNINISR